MLKYFIVLLFSSSIVFGVSVIDSGRRNGLVKIHEGEKNSDDIDLVRQDECPNLTPELIEEIKSHQSVVDDIVRAIVNGEYSGDTWNA